MTTQDIMNEVDAATTPGVMTKPEALEFLAELKDQIEGRMEAMRNANRFVITVFLVVFVGNTFRSAHYSSV